MALTEGYQHKIKTTYQIQQLQFSCNLIVISRDYFSL